MTHLSSSFVCSPKANRPAAEPTGLASSWNIRIGTVNTAGAMLDELKVSGCYVDQYAAQLIRSERFVIASDLMDVDLFAVKVSDLGFKRGGLYCYGEICFRAVALGLALCPAEVGPQLHLQHIALASHVVRIAMAPIAVSAGDFRIFLLRGCTAPLLSTADGYAERPWSSGSHFVFTRS